MMKNILLFIVVLTLYNCKTNEMISHNTEVHDLVTKIENDIYENFHFQQYSDGKKSLIPFKEIYNRKDFYIILIPKIRITNSGKLYKCNENFLEWINFNSVNYQEPDIYIYDKKNNFIDKFSYYLGFDKSLWLKNDDYIMNLYAKKVLEHKYTYIVDNKIKSNQFYVFKNENSYYTIVSNKFVTVNEFARLRGKDLINLIIQEKGMIIGGKG
ncbi:MAG: hypothetical protein ACR2MS_01610, partial [Weeksellaceae bacterium]